MRVSVSVSALLLGLAACSSPPVQPVAPAPSATPSATPSASGAPTSTGASSAGLSPSTPLGAACASLQKKHEGLIRQALEGEAPLADDITSELRRVGSCMPAGSGAWAVRLESLMSMPTPVEESSGSTITLNLGLGVLEVVFVDAKGAAPEPGHGHLLDITSFGLLSFLRLGTFDFDKDGTPELTLCVQAGGGNLDQDFERQCALLAWKDGKIQKYGGVPGDIVIRDIEDVDSDGRPDLLSMGPFEAPCEDPKKSPCVDQLLPGPAGFLYHALADGSFTPTDEAAKAFAKKAFPYDMKALFELDAPPPGSQARTLRAMGANAVRGALAFGEDRKKVRAALAAPRKGFCDDPRKCPYFDAMESWPVSPFWPNGKGK